MLLLSNVTDRTTPGRRVARKEQTRCALIEAAAAVIAERGFHAASLSEIAARAGVTTGAVYSNFRSKDDLFLAVIRERAVPLAPRAPTWQALIEACTEAARKVDEPETRLLLKLQLEFALLTIGHPQLAGDLVADLERDRAELAALLKGLDSVPLPSDAPPAEELATALVAALQGLQQHRFLDPISVPEGLVTWVIQALLHAARAGS